MLQLPVLLVGLSQHTGLQAEPATLLASTEGQNAVRQVFEGWHEAAKQQDFEAAAISTGHGPALLGFAAAACLVQSLPDASGQSLAGLSSFTV